MNAGTVVLRALVVVIGIALLVWAYILHAEGVPGQATLVLVVDGLLIVGAICFERKRYQPKVDTTKGNWTKTGEKFKDPTTGKDMEVVFNPDTGERDYIETS
jgi:hypothetical protein